MPISPTVSCQVVRRERQVSDETIGTGTASNRPIADLRVEDFAARKETVDLTFDMSGSHKWAKPACGCPFDGRARPHLQRLGASRHFGKRRLIGKCANDSIEERKQNLDAVTEDKWNE